MIVRGNPLRQRFSSSATKAVLLCCITLLILPFWFSRDHPVHSPDYDLQETQLFLAHEAERGQGDGGRWYIPQSWQEENQKHESPLVLPANPSILDVSEYVLGLASRQARFLNNSHIPRSIHQTWRNTNVEEWQDATRQCVLKWTGFARSSEAGSDSQMAWLLWDDHGIDLLMEKYEPQLYKDFHDLPYPVERADIFRIVVVKWFGGVYADIDTTPLKHPNEWISQDDLSDWTEKASHNSHSLHTPETQAYHVPTVAPASYESTLAHESLNAELRSTRAVNALFGIEADNPPELGETTYWRMGYRYSIQLTNWALAMAPQHAVADQFLAVLAQNITDNRDSLRKVVPLDLTGPPALTAAVRTVAYREDPSLSWDALSGRTGDPPGGRSKVVAGDALVLPITAFSPGRGWFQNMGSKSIEHENALLQHQAQGSWRKMDFKVNYGKLCRQMFGMCKDWVDFSID